MMLKIFKGVPSLFNDEFNAQEERHRVPLSLKRDFMSVYICGFFGCSVCSRVIMMFINANGVCPAPCRRRREKLQAHLKESRGLKNYSVSQPCKAHPGLQLHNVRVLSCFISLLFPRSTATTWQTWKRKTQSRVKPRKSIPLKKSTHWRIRCFWSISIHIRQCVYVCVCLRSWA